MAEERRNLQIEARAHIRVQREVDQLHVAGELPGPASVEFLRWLHRAFYEDAPEAMLRVEGAGRVVSRRIPRAAGGGCRCRPPRAAGERPGRP